MPTETNEGNANGTEECPVEQTPLSSGNEDVEVNITGCINSGKAIEDASEDLTECSSSFGDTGSDVEAGSAFSDTEVESQMCAGNASSPMCDDWSEPPRIRKRKMTTHWRRFAGPLMWRCKWLELKLKILHSQQLKYDKELRAYNYKRQLEFSKYAVDGFDVKSVPISNGIHRNKVMKRKKRKKGEECDVSSYMSSHNIFSYYENKDPADGACLEDFPGVATRVNAGNNEDLGLNVGGFSADHEDNGKFLDEIVRKIEAIESHVQKLKTQIDKVVSENPGKFRSATQSSNIGPIGGFNHSDLNSASFADLLMPGNTLPTHEGITPLIETIIRPQLEVPSENDVVLIQNQVVKEELHDLDNVGNELVEEPVEEPKSISLAQVSEPDLVDENAPHNARPNLKACSTSKPNYPRNTRRRRKSGRKSWRRR
ncbi:PREDICTED: uncharacterized protein LOC109360557 isoform X1 [Lupinus angustifolius]|uniref:uncharacterized protein LOC109360557 isoform X1 n=1 Tax=Lupinus angustifolius TaxID=3871 RepID=UPI00092F2039|nr:PREDICTED: uncharacterized protein LOC109360557 isoform X1 [Lupinus angustifolius]